MKTASIALPAAPVYAIMYTMKKRVAASKARKDFFKLLKIAGKPGSSVTITLEGSPPVIMISEDEYESLVETLDIMSDPQMMEAIREGEADIAAGRTVSWEQVKRELNL